MKGEWGHWMSHLPPICSLSTLITAQLCLLLSHVCSVFLRLADGLQTEVLVADDLLINNIQYIITRSETLFLDTLSQVCEVALLSINTAAEADDVCSKWFILVLLV